MENYHYWKIKIKMGWLYSSWTPTFLSGGGEGALPLDSKVIGMLVVFLGYKILILVFLESQQEVCAEMKFWYFLGSAHFPYRVKMKSF